MICRYCQQECLPVTPGPTVDGLFDSRIATCVPCQTDYWDSFHSLRCGWDGKHFEVNYVDNHPNNWTSVYQHYIPIPNSSCVTSKIVLNVKQYIKFTPANFKEKLKLLLLFS
jgi:hypothetical protein